jgi:uncharacterized protein YyaL (SSP411 family)
MVKSSNALANCSSPYLQQHAYNPVNWYPWGPEALQKAVEENKLLIISVGYSACHWCHVMEHESFEDEEVATVMNKFFVSIKVDREERPDIDALYMEAVQMLSGQGGWPLNCIALPDQRPIYGGTYFPKEQWREVLLQLADLWRNDPDKCVHYAAQLTDGMKKSANALLPDTKASDAINFGEIYTDWSAKFDLRDGGMQRAPKFPMPDNYRYLLAWSKQSGELAAKQHVLLTLKKMAAGGIYDQLGGGFARYSTDMQWKVPHFEKMLYDNAQLVILYSEAWQASKDPWFREVAEGIIEFVNRELTASDGGFYSALDADSEGVEGKYYVWTENELRAFLQEDFILFSDYFRVDKDGYWEHGNYILLRTEDENMVASKHGLSLVELKQKISVMKSLLLTERQKRIHPGLDNKILCGWNALMIRAFACAGTVFGNSAWTSIAVRRMEFLLEKLSGKESTLLHQLPGEHESAISGFLDDYAFTIEALISLYQATFDEKWITVAKSLTDTVIRDFSHEELPFFYFTSVNAEKLLLRRIELQDNVTPSGNAVMAANLYALGILTGNLNYTDRGKLMVDRMSDEVIRLTPWHSRWALESMLFATGRKEVVFAGASALSLAGEWLQEYHPSVLIAGAVSESGLSLLAERIPAAGKTLIYVCWNRTCSLPVDNLPAAGELVAG